MSPPGEAEGILPGVLALTVNRSALTADLEVPADNGQVQTKPFSQCSVEDMRRALQLKRQPGSSKPMPPGAVERGEQYHAAVKALFPKVTSVEVQGRSAPFRRARGGRGLSGRRRCRDKALALEEHVAALRAFLGAQRG